MSFEPISNLAPKELTQIVPPKGLLLKRRTANAARVTATYVQIRIGCDLARALVLLTAEVKIAVAFGTGRDVGKMCLSVDQTEGRFIAKRAAKGGVYAVTINQSSAAPYFAETFPPLVIQSIEAVRPENGGKPMCVFPISAAMIKPDHQPTEGLS